jgi:ribosomal protein S12 methylthiotransferase accessory factor
MREGHVTPWYASRFTGLFTQFGPVPPRPHDPALAVWAGTVPPGGGREQELATGGAGWNPEAAEAACVGEALERLQAYPLPDDQTVRASWQDWPLDEPAVEPAAWVLFHAEQYAQPGFPFQPFGSATECDWVCCRHAVTGEPWWAPAEFVYLFARLGTRHRLCPSVSTGLSCGRCGDPVLLRGLQEVLERDGVLGAWWGRYPLEEWDAKEIFDLLGAEIACRVSRPNLRYRFYRVASPFSAHVTAVTVEGEDREGYCFSIGSACRETRRAAWEKALLEALHGRHYVRHLKASRSPQPIQEPADFAEHARYYSLRPERLQETVLHRPTAPTADRLPDREELPALIERLGSRRPVLFRLMTPPAIAAEEPDWLTLKVLVPGLQPLHGHHRFAHLGGPLWAPRGLAEHSRMPPHPFP